ncbi:MAG TPA: ribonuclease P protein component [Chitinophagales bacterium]|nr:ribonuclease P protein component [Chitinophagales bacterium]
MPTFTRHERLKSKKLIERLFERGQSIDAPPLRMVWMPAIAFCMPAQVSFSVARRSFRQAVERNRIKRLMREAWRLRKQELYSFLSEKKTSLAVMLIFTGKKKPRFHEVQEKLVTIIQQLTRSV